MSRALSDGCQQLDRRESSTIIIAGQLALAGNDHRKGGEGTRRVRTAGCTRVAQRGIICTNIYMNDRATAVDDPSAAP